MKENMYYVIVDIGCLECGEPSKVIGIYKNKEKAEKEFKKILQIYDEANDKGIINGMHDIVMFEQELEKPYYPYYAKED